MGKKKHALQKSVNERLGNDVIANSRNFSGDYRGQSIKRLKLTKCHFRGAKFNDAAVTGSFFFDCDFSNCDMDQGDFEYCDFYECDITSKKPISIAFNNSNFIDSQIYNLNFYSSTFSNAFFDTTSFKSVDIENCTLEGATFNHCTFDNVKLTETNIDYVEFFAPTFCNSSKIPMEQIIYTFGLLQYLMETDDSVVILGKNKIITKKDYLEKKLPKILQSFLNADIEKETSILFPLINILLALRETEQAANYLHKALNLSASIQDFRMIKHYCKLMNLDNNYSRKQKRKLYYEICNKFQPNLMTPWQLKNHSRNMGDIKYILLIENNLPTLVFHFMTNIFNKGIKKTGIIIQDIFQISKKYQTSPDHDIRIELSRNSPIMVSIEFTEAIQNIVAFLQQLLMLTCSNATAEKLYLKELATDSLNQCLNVKKTPKITKKCLTKYVENDIELSLVEFHIENWKYEYNSQFEGTIPFKYLETR